MRRVRGGGLSSAPHTQLGGDHGHSKIPRTTAFAEQLDFLVDDRLLRVYPGWLHTGE